jgi:hypothetical protein
VEVHEIVDNPTLQIVPDAVDDHLSAHVHNLEVRQVVLITILIDRLVDLLIVANAFAEVQSGLLRILTLVVRASGLNVPDVGHDELLIVALGLDEDDLDSLLLEQIDNPFAALLGAVGGVENADDTLLLLEPLQHVRDGGLGGSTALALALGIVSVEEVGRRVRGIVAAVVTDVEGLRRDRQPLKVSLGWQLVSTIPRRPSSRPTTADRRDWLAGPFRSFQELAVRRK